MSGFANAVVGGVGKLVRSWIQSPNYVAKLSGWTINQDGSAEFNDITVRGLVLVEGASGEILIYNGAPAQNTLILSLAGAISADPYGNQIYPGLNFYPNFNAAHPAFNFWSSLVLNNASISEGVIAPYELLTLSGPTAPVGAPAEPAPFIQLGCNTNTGDGLIHARVYGVTSPQIILEGPCYVGNPQSTPVNMVQRGVITANFNNTSAIGGTLVFPTAFASVPSVQLTPQIGSNLDILVNLQAVAANQFSWRAWQAKYGLITAACDIHWRAEA